MSGLLAFVIARSEATRESHLHDQSEITCPGLQTHRLDQGPAVRRGFTPSANISNNESSRLERRYPDSLHLSLRGAKRRGNLTSMIDLTSSAPICRLTGWANTLLRGHRCRDGIERVGVREMRPHSGLLILPPQLADFERARYSLQSSEKQYRRQIYVR